MKYITAFIVGLGAAMIVVAALMFARSAHAAEWPQSEWRKAPKVERKYSRPKRMHRKRRKPRVKAWVRKHKHLNAFENKRPAGCMAEIRVTGTQFLSENGAKERAQKAWEGMVQFKHGELYADLRFARDIRYQCVRSSVENIANRASEAVGINTQLKRCLIWATPCIAPLTK